MLKNITKSEEKIMANNFNMKDVEKRATELGNDMAVVSKELKRVQSIKCRLNKQKGRADYADQMKAVLAEEHLLKNVRQLLNPKEKAVTAYEQYDVDMLDYDETVKAIRSIQSKKTLTRWLTPVEGDNDEFRTACKIEEMLIKHRDEVRPVDDAYIRKTDLQTIIDTIEGSGELTQDRIVEMLKALMVSPEKLKNYL